MNYIKNRKSSFVWHTRFHVDDEDAGRSDDAAVDFPRGQSAATLSSALSG